MRGITPAPENNTPGEPMTGQEHYRLTEEFAEKARDRLSRGDNQDAIACAAIAQVHAALVDLSGSRRKQATTQPDPRDMKINPSWTPEFAFRPSPIRASKRAAPRGGSPVTAWPGFGLSGP